MHHVLISTSHTVFSVTGNQSDSLHRGDQQHGWCYVPLSASCGVTAPLRQHRQNTRKPPPTSWLPCHLCHSKSSWNNIQRVKPRWRYFWNWIESLALLTVTWQTTVKFVGFFCNEVAGPNQNPHPLGEESTLSSLRTHTFLQPKWNCPSRVDQSVLCSRSQSSCFHTQENHFLSWIQAQWDT